MIQSAKLRNLDPPIFVMNRRNRFEIKLTPVAAQMIWVGDKIAYNKRKGRPCLEDIDLPTNQNDIKFVKVKSINVDHDYRVVELGYGLTGLRKFAILFEESVYLPSDQLTFQKPTRGETK